MLVVLVETLGALLPHKGVQLDHALGSNDNSELSVASNLDPRGVLAIPSLALVQLLHLRLQGGVVRTLEFVHNTAISGAATCRVVTQEWWSETSVLLSLEGV